MEMVSKVEALKSAGFTEEQINKMVGIIGFNKDEVIQSDEISNQVYANRGAMNGVSFRRKITAQFLRGHFYHKGGIQEYINRKDYNWQFEMMLEECRQLSKMEKNGDKELEIRSRFFTLDIIRVTVEQYCKDLRTFLYQKLEREHKRCKGIPYVKYNHLPRGEFFKGCCFKNDIYSRIIAPADSMIWNIDRAKNYTEMYEALLKFCKSKNFIKLPFDTEKSRSWIDAFKGEGAYYSMMNLSQFSDLVIRDYNNNRLLNKYEARCYLESMTKSKSGYELYGQFKQMIKDNNFDMESFRAICIRTRHERLSK